MLVAGYLSSFIFACTMGGQEQPPENWASRPDVEQLLAYMLAMPAADHNVEVAAVLNGGALCTAQAISLLRLSSPADEMQLSDQKLAVSMDAASTGAAPLRPPQCQ